MNLRKSATYGLLNTSKGRNSSNQYQLSSSNHFLALNIAPASRYSNDNVTFRIHSKVTSVTIFVTLITW